MLDECGREGYGPPYISGGRSFGSREDYLTELEYQAKVYARGDEEGDLTTPLLVLKTYHISQKYGIPPCSGGATDQDCELMDDFEFIDSVCAQEAHLARLRKPKR